MFISSVTEGLRQERIALPGLIRALGMDPIRFEDFTSLPEPSRDVCLQAVESSEVYLLLLGDHYGARFPDTGLSATHEEYRAALNKGLPRLAFRRRAARMESAQAAFAEEVEAYQSGLFRGSWEEIGELLSEVSAALSNLETLSGQLVFTPLGAPINVGWLTVPDPRDQFSGFGHSSLEVYLTPSSATLTGGRLRVAGEIAARLMRDVGIVSQHEAIEVSAQQTGGVAVQVTRPSSRRALGERAASSSIEGLSISPLGEVCATTTLGRDLFGAVVDMQSLSVCAMPLVDTAGRVLAEVASDASLIVVPSVAITGATSVTLGNPEVVGNRNAATIPMRGASVIMLPGDESAILSAVISGARDVAMDLAARAEHALRIR